MTNYDVLILKQLQGSNPKEKYEYLLSVHRLLQQVVFPGCGTEEEGWTIQDVADKIMEKGLVSEFENYENY